jgi:hypothetical protein
MAQKGGKVLCPSCGSDNLPGTLFCLQCGTYLPSGGPLRTEPLPEQVDGDPAEPHRVGMEQEEASKMVQFNVVVQNTRRTVSLSADREIVVGRLDAAHGIFPELDMTPDSGLEGGVSRRHARIYVREGVCFIEDLDSTNGTFLNGERITPYLPYAFQDGDVLTFGTLRLEFNILTAAE